MKLFKKYNLLLLIFIFNCSKMSMEIKPTSFINKNNNDNQLKLLSWNIKMFPAPYGWFLNRNQRANNIISFLYLLNYF